jgi:tetratricopeptide (TPR) repeat protein
MTSLQRPPSPGQAYRAPSPAASILSNSSNSAPAFYVSSQLVDSAVQDYFDGKYEKALKSFATALKTQQLTLGEVDIVVAHTLGNISAVYIAMGMLEEAMHVLQECLSIKMKLRSDPNYILPQGCEAVIIADTLNNLGSTSFLRGEYYDAMSYYQSCLKELTEGPIPGSKSDLANVLYNIGNVHCLLNELDDALMAMAESLQLTQVTLSEGKEEPQAAEVMEKIGAIYLSQNKLDDAMTAFLEALTITKTCMGSEHVDCAVSAYNVGMVYECKGESRRAIESYNSALEIYHLNGIDDSAADLVRQRLMQMRV